jgi:hypothetical protein
MTDTLLRILGETFEVVTLGATLGSLGLGLVIGAAYAWRRAELGDVYQLWLVGIAFVIAFTAYAYAAGDPAWGRQLARAILWTVVAVGIVNGQRLRRRLEARRLRRRLDRVTPPR